ncbi:MAG: GDSL-type esterase/lipase family protein [Bacteroidota bacterium]
MHKPIHTLLFLIGIFVSLISLTALFPENGIYITNKLSIHFPTFASFFEKTQKKTDISNIIALADAEDADTLKGSSDTALVKEIELKDSTIKLNTSIQYKDASKSAMDNFFSALANIDSEPKSIRILHYGDSQIEGDRISDYLRLKLQGQFGGAGPGLISFMPVAPSVINKISWSSTWDRYQVFAGKDKRVKHNNFGAMAHLTRFAPYTTLTDTASYRSAWIKFVTSKNGGPSAAAFTKIKLFYGGAQAKTHVELYENGSLNNSDSLAAGGNFNIKEFNLNQGALLHEFKFKGKDSPDFYGVSLEGSKGVMVDNFGLRGSSGTFFNQINYGQLKNFYDYLNARLIILQFGGNTLPYITTKEQTDNFGNYLKAQINTIKKLAPQASILVIGPADMSVKEGAEYVTHPQLENLRDAIKRTAFETDCAFFDMYNCMGGKNSMLTWVEQGVAAKDYIHFSSGGARKIAVLLYSSLINDYNSYLKKK